MIRLAPALLLSLPFYALAQDAAPQRLSPYGLPRPVIIANGAIPESFPTPNDALILDLSKAEPPNGFQFLAQPTDSPSTGKVGLHIPPGAIFQIDKRKMMNAGQGSITLSLAKSNLRPARTVELSGKSSADLNEWHRCALERAAGSLYPPKEPSVPNVPKGTLVIVGGGGMPKEIADRFLEAGGGPDGQFVVLPISMPDPINVKAEETFLKRMGAKNVIVIPHREQKDLESPEVIATFEKATGIWFGGGRQWNFMDAYEGTKLPTLFRGVLERGGVIGGSSAGATIQGDYLVRGAPAGPHIMMCEGYERGLCFLPGVGIDQHFSARNRFKDLTAFVNAYPQFLGIGIDEATALVVTGSTGEVLGRGKVHFYDRRKPIAEGAPDYEAYPAGSKYDLIQRAPIR